MNNIILSICIPTYNRAECLQNTIESIVSQELFQTTNEIEIVISDNCSTDNTAEVVDFFKEIYGGKILYFRNDENIMDKNFEAVLLRSNGLFLKLNNDSLKHYPSSLESMLATIKANINSKIVLFFLNQSLTKGKSSHYNSLDEFVSKVSYYATWIGGFGIWKDDFNSLTTFNRYAHLQLTQTDVLYRLVDKKNESFVNNDLLFKVQDVNSKGGYDLLNVFLDNYSYILKDYIDRKKVSEATYKTLTKRVLLKIIRPSLVLSVVYPEKFKFHRKSAFKKIVTFFRADPFIIIVFFITYYLHLSYKLIYKVLDSVRAKAQIKTVKRDF